MGRSSCGSFDVEANGDKVPVSLPSSTKFTSGANGRKYAEAMLGRHLADEEELDLEELYGAQCRSSSPSPSWTAVHSQPD